MKLFGKEEKEKAEKIEVEKFEEERHTGGKKFIRFLKRRYKLLIFVLILIIAGVFGYRYWQQKQKAAAMSQVATITTESIERKTLSNTISITGTIAANDSQTVYSNNQGCEVTAINVKVGDYVSAGDVIATLDSSDYEDEIAAQEKKRAIAVEKAQLSAEQAARDLAEASVDASTDISRAQEDINDACEDYSAVVDSKSTAYNNYLLACDATNAARSERDAKGEVLEAKKAAFKEIKKTLSANDAEYIKAQEAMNTAQTAYNTADAAVATAEKNESTLLTTYQSYGDKLTSAVRNYESAVEKQQDTTTSAARSIEKSQDSVTSSNLDSSTVTDDYDKQIEEYQKQIDKCTVTAAISGVVTSIPMEVGDEISNDNNEICVIQDDSSYIVEATVDQYDISNLYEGMEAVIKTDATDDLEMAGTVTFVSPTPETSSSSGSSMTGSSSSTTAYPIKIAIKDKNDKLRIGMTAETSVITEQVEDVLAVPYDCIQTDADGNSVIYVIDNNMTGVSGNKASGKMEKVSGNKASGKAGNVSGNKAGQRPDGNMPSDMSQPAQKSIIVETGLETDYYTEIKSSEVTEGMQVVVPNSITSNADKSSKSDSNSTGFSFGGGGNMGGGAPSGGGPGGGPGGF